MRRILAYFVLSCLIILYLPKNPVFAMQKPDSCFLDKRACWISYLDFEQYLRDQDEDTFRANVSHMYDIMLQNDLNTAIVQVRAFGDAIYPSNIFPMATYISTQRNTLGYDALEIMIDLAHKKGLCFEAWINPYRLAKDDATTESYKKTQFYNQHRDIIIEYTNDNGETALSLDPSLQITRELILNGIDELLTNYSIDAIHFDDYFYMNHMDDTLTIEEKKANVNVLIYEVHSHTEEKHVPFGISPAGNIDYALSVGADVNTWLRELGYIDYIMPQLYWSDDYYTDGDVIPLYSNRCEQWKELNMINIPMYAGLGLYRIAEKDDIDKGWSMRDTNLLEQCDYAREQGYEGYCLFRYAWLEKEQAYNELINLKYYIAEQNINCDNMTEETQIDRIPYVPFVKYYKTSYSGLTNNLTGKVNLHLYKTDGTMIVADIPCCSFVLNVDNVKDITITYLNDDNEDCMVFYCTKKSDGEWNKWVSDGKFTNYEQFCTITEVKIMRIPRKTVKNTCFFVDSCYN